MQGEILLLFNFYTICTSASKDKSSLAIFWFEISCSVVAEYNDTHVDR